jgi:hypothetical protein
MIRSYNYVLDLGLCSYIMVQVIGQNLLDKPCCCSRFRFDSFDSFVSLRLSRFFSLFMLSVLLEFWLQFVRETGASHAVHDPLVGWHEHHGSWPCFPFL